MKVVSIISFRFFLCTASAVQVLTLHFVHMASEAETEDAGAELWVRDGADERAPLLGRVAVRNATRPQSLTTTRNSVRQTFI